jgi:hypothetical protein
VEHLVSEKVNIGFLDSVFDQAVLAADAEFLKQQLGATTSYLNQRGVANVRAAFHNASRDRSLGSAISLYSLFCPPSCNMSEDVGETLIGRCLLSMKHIQQDTASRQYTRIVDRALGRELAPYYVALWEWFAVHAPTLTSSLWRSYLAEDGTDQLMEKYPGFSSIFLLLEDSLQEWYLAIPRHKTAKHAAGESHDIVPCEITREHFKNLKHPDHSAIPAKLTIRPHQRTLIPSPETSFEDFKRMHSQLFIEVIYRMLMHSQLTIFYNKSITGRERKPSSRSQWIIKPSVSYDAFKDILTVRGGTLYLLLQAFQTESIFALAPVQKLIEKPWSLFTHSSPRYEHLGKVFSRTDEVDQLINMFRDQLEAKLDHHDWFHSTLSEVGQRLYRHTLQLEANRILTDKEFLDKKSLVTPADQQAIIRRGWRIHQSELDKASLTVGDLVASDAESPEVSVNLHPFILIIRQALRNVRLPERIWSEDADFILQNMQLGRHIYTAKPSHGPDHMNCIREDLGYVRLLCEHISPQLIRTPIGFVNHFIDYTTGQSPQTAEFLAIHPKILESIDDLKLKLSRAQFEFGMEWNQMENSSLWATCNDYIGWRGHGHREDPAERFAHLFDPVQLEVIRNFLNEPDEKRTWRSTHDWILKNMHFSGVNNLTLLQLVNNLAYLGLTQKPTLDELALWVSQNDLGALAGLEFLGFKKTLHNPRHTRTILMLLHDHLDWHLSSEDKATLHFDTIFLEHLLCKVARWSREYNHTRDPKDLVFSDFTQMVCQAAEGKSSGWDGVRNVCAVSPDMLPIPCIIPKRIWEDTLNYAHANVDMS